MKDLIHNAELTKAQLKTRTKQKQKGFELLTLSAHTLRTRHPGHRAAELRGLTPAAQGHQVRLCQLSKKQNDTSVRDCRQTVVRAPYSFGFPLSFMSWNNLRGDFPRDPRVQDG